MKLDPHNAEALSDLGDFYKEAPEIVGGGMDKAEAMAAQLDKIDPARAHLLRARIAESRKDYGTAEREFKQAIATAAHPAHTGQRSPVFIAVDNAGQIWTRLFAAAKVRRKKTNTPASRSMTQRRSQRIESRSGARCPNMLQELFGQCFKI